MKFIARITDGKHDSDDQPLSTSATTDVSAASESAIQRSAKHTTKRCSVYATPATNENDTAATASATIEAQIVAGTTAAAVSYTIERHGTGPNIIGYSQHRQPSQQHRSAKCFSSGKSNAPFASVFFSQKLIVFEKFLVSAIERVRYTSLARLRRIRPDASGPSPCTFLLPSGDVTATVNTVFHKFLEDCKYLKLNNSS